MENNQAYQNEIYENMQLKDTAELLDIWRKNDRRAWTSEAMNIVQQILIDRLGMLPPQDPPEEGIVIEPSANHLLWIASTSGALSWIGLILTGLIIIGLILESYAPAISNQPASLIIIFLIVVLAGGGFFLTMQFIARGVPILLDLQDKTDRITELLEEESEEEDI